jgi:hypothetical protein
VHPASHIIIDQAGQYNSLAKHFTSHEFTTHSGGEYVRDRYIRFIDMAREDEADEDPEAIDRAFERVIRSTPPQSPKRHAERKE